MDTDPSHEKKKKKRGVRWVDRSGNRNSEMYLEIVSLLGGIMHRARHEHRASWRNFVIALVVALVVSVFGLHRCIGIPDSVAFLMGLAMITVLVFDVAFTHMPQTFRLDREFF
jgi:hypothetical protein